MGDDLRMRQCVDLVIYPEMNLGELML